MIKPDTLIASLAFLIATVSLFTTIEHNKLSVEPYLNYEWVIDHKNYSYSLAVKNIGIGPGIITSFQLLVDEKKITSDKEGGWRNVINKLYNLDRMSVVDIDGLKKGDGIGVGEKRALIYAQITEELVKNSLEKINKSMPGSISKSVEEQRKEFFQAVGESLSRIGVEIEYRNIYTESKKPVAFRYISEAKKAQQGAPADR